MMNVFSIGFSYFLSVGASTDYSRLSELLHWIHAYLTIMITRMERTGRILHAVVSGDLSINFFCLVGILAHDS